VSIRGVLVKSVRLRRKRGARRSRAEVMAGLAAVALTGSVLVVLPGPAQAAPAGTPHYPDLQTVIPLDSFSTVQTATGREFRYTHLIYNNGPGPLEIQPQYNEASGAYQGYQQVFTHNAAGVWSMVSQRRVPDAFVYHAEHGHFHFPLAAFGLYAVAPDGSPGAPVALSPKNGFCISDSYIYNSTIEHSGVFVGSQGSCTDPTSLRGLSVGGADEYDYRDPGQSVPIDGLPDGPYWFRAVSDPNNDLVETDESNNETDVLVTISNGRVTTGQVTHPNTTPPAVTLSTPADGARVSGSVSLTAASSGAASVQYVVDGNPVATTTAGPNFTASWNSASVVDGVHWLAARSTDSAGRTNSSAVAQVTVANVSPPPDGVLATDGVVSLDGRGTVTAPPLSTTKPGDLVLAFVGSDGRTGSQTFTVSGGGLTWSLVRRANSRPGSSEIWKAVAPGTLNLASVTSTPSQTGLDQSLRVVAFAGAAGVGGSVAAGAATGAPKVSLTTTAAGSLVLGVGNDWDGATTRTPGAGQTINHQWVDTATGDTYWMQARNAPSTAAGQLTGIDDTAPVNHEWNLAAVEVVPSATTPPPQDTTPPQVSVTDPSTGQTVSGIVAFGAIASDDVGVVGVQFKVDGVAVGAAVTTPPFMTQWDSRTATQGSHSITAVASDAAGHQTTSAPVTVTVDNSAPPPATITATKLATAQSRGPMTASSAAAVPSGRQLVAFVASDGPSGAGGQQTTVSGGGLTWTLVKRSNSQAGVAEIWTARTTAQLASLSVAATPSKTGYDGLLAVFGFANASGVGVAGAGGAPTGAPDTYLPGIGTGSWVFAVGNDWDRAVARTPAAGQVLQHQWLDTSAGDTFWVQSTTAPNTAPGLVTVHDSAPTNDRWNLAAVEVLPSPGS
jgi:Bacterial Ig domain/Lysyl oxidase